MSNKKLLLKPFSLVLLILIFSGCLETSKYSSYTQIAECYPFQTMTEFSSVKLTASIGGSLLYIDPLQPSIIYSNSPSVQFHFTADNACITLQHDDRARVYESFTGSYYIVLSANNQTKYAQTFTATAADGYYSISLPTTDNPIYCSVSPTMQYDFLDEPDEGAQPGPGGSAPSTIERHETFPMQALNHTSRIIVDTTGPSVSFTPNTPLPSFSKSNKTTSVYFTVTDSANDSTTQGSGVKAVYIGAKVVPPSSTSKYSYDFNIGTNTIYAKDQLNNQGRDFSFTITADDQAPVILLGDYEITTDTNSLFSRNLSFTESQSGLSTNNIVLTTEASASNSILLSNTDATHKLTFLKGFPIEDQAHQYFITATDNAGNSAVVSDYEYRWNPASSLIDSAISVIQAPNSSTSYNTTLSINKSLTTSFDSTDTEAIRNNVLNDYTIQVKRKIGQNGVLHTVGECSLSSISNANTSTYSISDTIPISATASHQDIFYSFTLLWHGIQVNNGVSNKTLTLENTSPTIGFSYSGGIVSGKSLSSSTEAILYTNPSQIDAGNASLSYTGGSDPDLDTLQYYFVETVTDGSGNPQNIEYPFTGKSLSFSSLKNRFVSTATNLSELDGSLIVRETQGSYTSDSEKWLIRILQDSGKPVVDKMGREAGADNKLVNYTLASDFTLTLHASEAETYLGAFRVWLGEKDNASWTPQTWLKKNADDTLSESEKAEISSSSSSRLGIEYALNTTQKDLSKQLPWTLPNQDGTYPIYAQIIDVAGNAATPMVRIIRGANLTPNTFQIYFDLNAPMVWNRSSDTEAGGDTSAAVALPFCMMVNDVTGITVASNITGPSTADNVVINREDNGASEVSFYIHEYGNYRATIEATKDDTVKNDVYDIRINQPPVIKAPLALTVTSGQSVDMNVATVIGQSLLFVKSDDGVDGPYQSKWSIYSSTGDKVGGSADYSDASYRYTFEKALATQSASYRVDYIVRDKWGLVVKGSIPITVSNTQSGTMLESETWTGTHTITGMVVVPSGITLTVQNCVVSAMNGNSGKDQAGIFVMPGGILNIDSSSFVDVNTIPNTQWAGLHVQGTTTITSSAVSGAIRGCVIESSATAIISAAHFSQCLVGLHVIGSHPNVSGSRFENCTGYGVKEDASGSPVLTGCHFTGNTNDYYDCETGKILSGSGTNVIAGNHENE